MAHLRAPAQDAVTAREIDVPGLVVEGFFPSAPRFPPSWAAEAVLVWPLVHIEYRCGRNA